MRKPYRRVRVVGLLLLSALMAMATTIDRTSWVVRANAIVLPLQIRIVRDMDLPEVMQIGDCIHGKLYIQDSEHPLTHAGDVLIGETLELPWKWNTESISAIPAGSYTGTIREDGDLGWRIAIQNVPKRVDIEIHIGNWPKNSTGCILLGTNKATNKICTLENSAVALKKLRDLYASPGNKRPVVINIE
jgi:Family of unknown function (DUF5675)